VIPSTTNHVAFPAVNTENVGKNWLEFAYGKGKNQLNWFGKQQSKSRSSNHQNSIESGFD
jgi:hypothetical protein